MNADNRNIRDALNALNDGDWNRAAQAAGEITARAPGQAVAHFIAGVAWLELRRLSPAIEHLQSACKLESGHSHWFAQLARAFSAARLNQQAITVADIAWSLKPSDQSTLAMLGRIYADSQAHLMAVTVLKKAVELTPNQAANHFSLATALVSTGDIAGAEYALLTCLTVDPKAWRAHLALSHLRTQSIAGNHIERLLGLIENHDQDHQADICLNMALAKEYEDLQQYAVAFDYLTRGKAAARRDIHYDPVQDEKLFEAIRHACPGGTASSCGNQSQEPIFVFGMPRSGTTLVDRILSSHPDVYSEGELQTFGIALRQHWGRSTPLWDHAQSAECARQLDWLAVGESYLSGARSALNQKLHFIDKLPHNFLYAGFIAMAFPNARMICLRRDAMDTCLANFRQLFVKKLPYYHYSFDLMDIGHYYVLFDRLISHWRRVFPGRIHEIHYEDLVQNQEVTTRKLLTFCGLQWQKSCLQFETNSGPVATASSVHVREPIYRSAMHRWKAYENELKPLLDYLNDSGIDLGR